MVGLEDIGVYIACLHNTVAQYIATHAITELCLVAEWKPELHIYMQWWEHTALYILGNRAGHASEEEGGGDGDRRIGGKWRGIVGYVKMKEGD